MINRVIVDIIIIIVGTSVVAFLSTVGRGLYAAHPPLPCTHPQFDPPAPLNVERPHLPCLPHRAQHPPNNGYAAIGFHPPMISRGVTRGRGVSWAVGDNTTTQATTTAGIIHEGRPSGVTSSASIPPLRMHEGQRVGSSSPSNRNSWEQCTHV